MVSFEEVWAMLEDIASKLPKEIYVSLNGGINLSPEAKLHPENRRGDLFIMGEYCHNEMGRYINIFYGSLMQVYPHLTAGQMEEKVGEILKHEFVHHLESMAGENELIIKDMIDIEKYKRKIYEVPDVKF